MITAQDGKQYQVKHYSLDMILAIGFRVRSPRGVQFRRWANTQLRTYLDKGFLLDKERLKKILKVDLIILMNYWNKFVKFEPVNCGFIKKYESYLNYPVTTIKQIKSLKCFLQKHKIS